MYNLKIEKKSENETVFIEKLIQFIILECNIISQSYAILYFFILYF